MTAILDVFPHILPSNVLERFSDEASGWTKSYLDGFRRNPSLAPQWDLSVRFRQMDEVGDYAQVPTLNMPPIEHVAGGRVAVERELATLANDTLALLVQEHPDRFKGFAAALPIDDVDASIVELERAVRTLGALGVQLFTNANGLPMDDPRFEPLFAKISELGCFVWIHGARASTIPEYEREVDSRYGMWLALGWPYEMGLCAGRLVLSGLFDRYPNLRMYLHHSGGMLAAFAHRINGSGIQYGPDGHETEQVGISSLKRPALDYLRNFYVDTSGNSPVSVSAALQFFGPDRVLLGSDSPFRVITDHLEMMNALPLDDDVRERIYHLNAERELGL